MYTLHFTNQFKKDLKKIAKRGLVLAKLDKVIQQLEQTGKVDPARNPHRLSGNWDGYWVCHVQGDWVLVYLIEEEVKLIRLERTGSHSEALGKQNRK